MIDTNSGTKGSQTQDLGGLRHTGKRKNPLSLEKRMLAMGWQQPGLDVYVWTNDNRRLYISRIKGVVIWKLAIDGMVSSTFDALSSAVSALEAENEGEKGEKTHAFEGGGR